MDDSILFIEDQDSSISKLKQYYDDVVKKSSSTLNCQFIATSDDILDNFRMVQNCDIIITDLLFDADKFLGLNYLEWVRERNSMAKLILITDQFLSEADQKRCERINAEFFPKSQGVKIFETIKYFIKSENREEKIKHVFISYKSVDYEKGISKLVDVLEKNGISVWIDKKNILPGQDWQIAIRRAIEDGMFFLACFSRNYWKNSKNYMNEELNLAIEQLRKLPDDHVWFIPIKLDDCEIPHFEIRQNKTLGSKQFVRLYDNWDREIFNILKVIKSK